MKDLTFAYCLKWCEKHDKALHQTMVVHGEHGMNMKEVSDYIRDMKKQGKK